MKIRYLAATGLLVVLAACGGTAGNESNVAGNASDAPANVAAPAADAAPPAAAPSGDRSAMSEAFIVGRWAEEGEDCADAVEFKADGTMAGSIFDGERWRLEGDQLIMVGNPNPITVVRVDDDHMRRTNAGGTSTVARCAAP